MSGPWRRDFDAARDPYTARNALGIQSPVASAPVNAQYITAAADPTLIAERVLTNTATITWDFTTPGQAKASAAGGGNVSNSGTPAAGQYGKWVTATTIQGVAPATVLSDIGAQPLDGDLTAIAALAGTNVIYYRSAANTWSAVTIGANLTFTAGTLAATGGGISTIAIQKFTASGTYTPTSGMKFCLVEMVAGGGGGAGITGGTTVAAAGSGGGSGGYSRKLLNVAAVGSSVGVTIGAGGAGGPANSNGTAGGDTFVGASLATALCAARGGSGGGAADIYSGGAGGIVTGAVGDLIAAGAPGLPGSNINQLAPNTGQGGSSAFGGGGLSPGRNAGGVYNGNNAGNYGSGGSGGYVHFTAASATGGSGSSGFILITEYI